MSWVVSLKTFDPYNPAQHTYERLIEYLMDYCYENPIDHLDDTEYLEKIESEVNNYINLYTICDDINFNRLM